MRKHAAILIHGIGQEQRYEITDDFVQGLARVWDLTSEVVFPKALRGVASLVTHATRVTFNDPAKPILDVFEVYWAPLTKGRTTLNSLLGWLLLNTFLPGRMLRFPSAKNRFVLAYALSALVLVAIALGVIVVLLQFTAGQLAPDLRQKGILGLLGALGWWRILLTILGIYLALQVFYRVGELYKDLRGPQATGVNQQDRRRERIVDVLLLAAFVSVFVLLRRLVATPFYDFALAFALYRLVTLGLHIYFVNYLGDIQVYVTRDENNGRYVARAAVLEEAVQMLASVLCSAENYESVVLLGHSLGSVVGLDAIRELAARVNAGQIQQSDFSRLGALVTFGSPLEKTLFFFGRGARRDDQGTVHFKGHVKKALETSQTGIDWYNGWYFRDIIADRLTSYGTVTNWDLDPLKGRSRFFLRWVHSDYLSDEGFLRRLAPIL
jgi:hypothetical protein